MFTFLKKSKTARVQTYNPDFVSLKEVENVDVNQLVKEIHENFYTEVDRLLEMAQIKHSLETDKSELLEKSKKLMSLGFVNAKEVQDARSEAKRLDQLKKENKEKEDLVEAIKYFSSKYPMYRFITEDSVQKICAKYNLVYGSVDRYIGTVPDENLKHIENFKIQKEDECFYFDSTFNGISARGSIVEPKRDYISLEVHEALLKEHNGNVFFKTSFGTSVYTSICPLEIAAPAKDFKHAKVVDSRIIEIPDPVVLKPVMFNNKKHYLIITAWGIEAKDDLVLNAKHN